MAFITFVACYVPMCFVIGVACAAISASAWPFVVPILLSFDAFGDFETIFDPVLLSIIIDLSNAMVLCFIYQRKGKVAWHPATVLGLIAAIPAVGLAFLAQEVLPKFQDTIKKLSGWGLFVFAMIFIIKGFKLRAAARAAEALSAGTAALAAAQSGAAVGTADVSVEVGGTEGEGTSKTGFTVGSPEEREKGETTGLTGAAAASATEPGCWAKLTTWDELVKLGPEGTAVSSSKLGLLSLATMGAGALAGFIGFGNGLLFATMLIVGLGHPTQEGTATACASTSVLMSAVFLVYVQQLRGWMLKYIGVAVASSMVGAYTGCAFASSLSPVSINFFVGGMLVICAVLAVVPSFFAGDEGDAGDGGGGGRRLLEDLEQDLEQWWSVLIQ